MSYPPDPVELRGTSTEERAGAIKREAAMEWPRGTPQAFYVAMLRDLLSELAARDEERAGEMDDLTQPKWQTYQEFANDPGQYASGMRTMLECAALDLRTATSEIAVRDSALRDACGEIVARRCGYSDSELIAERPPLDEDVRRLAAEFLTRARERKEQT